MAMLPSFVLSTISSWKRSCGIPDLFARRYRKTTIRTMADIRITMTTIGTATITLSGALASDASPVTGPGVFTSSVVVDVADFVIGGFVSVVVGLAVVVVVLGGVVVVVLGGVIVVVVVFRGVVIVVLRGVVVVF